MCDVMNFPKTINEFIEQYSFKDSHEIYTNGCYLIPVFRIEQAIEHYEHESRCKAIDDFAEALKDKYACCGYVEELAEIDIDEIAEHLKAGGENETVL